MPRTLILAIAAAGALACGDATEPDALDGTWQLVSVGGLSVPTDPALVDVGCCLTLSGSIAFEDDRYDLRTSHRNINNGILFDNSEQGTYERSNGSVQFTRVSVGDAGFPYLIGGGVVSDGDRTLTLLVGDEGPGSDQEEMVFVR